MRWCGGGVAAVGEARDRDDGSRSPRRAARGPRPVDLGRGADILGLRVSAQSGQENKERAIVAKKKAAKKTAPKKPATPKAAKKKTASGKQGKAKKKPDARHASHDDDIRLDPTEEKAFDVVESSDLVRDQLEIEVTTAAVKVVRKVLKANGIDLSQQQAERLTVVLFG